MVVTGFDPALLRDAVSGYRRCASYSPYFTHSRATVTFASCRKSRKRSRRSQMAVRPPVTCSSASAQLQSETELFLDSLEKETASELPSESNLTVQLRKLETQSLELQKRIDDLYQSAFAHAQSNGNESDVEASTTHAATTGLTEEAFGRLGRAQPEAMKQLLHDKETSDPKGWAQTQQQIQTAKLQRTRLTREIEDLKAALVQAEEDMSHDDLDDVADSVLPGGKDTVSICLITGFESFNISLYSKVAKELAEKLPNVRLHVFSDRDLQPKRAQIEAALDSADVFFGSLLFDYDQVEWLKSRVEKIPLRLVFESALELMSATQIGTFQMGSTGGKSKGPPPAVKKLLGLFGSQREEDRMVGYLSFLKLGPKLLKFLPGQKAKDLRNWLTVYSYWNQGGRSNVVAMFAHLVDQYFKPTGTSPAKLLETPATGCLHPAHDGYFSSPAEYMKWYKQHGPLGGDPIHPTVAVLLYRKHVITEQMYIGQLISNMEQQGVRPIPIFINGIEAHTVVRDLLTSTSEQAAKGKSKGSNPTLKADAVPVDAVVSTIGFPLVGGPAGTMEGGRQADVAKGILTAKNIPYIIAAPLLIQDMASWSRDGIAGLQSVRIKEWVHLRRSSTQDRKIAVLLYGFPPGVGATGTAALLNVPASLAKLLEGLQQQGYDLGPDWDSSKLDGEAVISALKMQEEQRAIYEGKAGIENRGAGGAEAFGASAVAAEIDHLQLKQMLTYPPDWGPSEWGPIPFLPEADVLVSSMERQWGDLAAYRGIATSVAGNAVVSGIQLGNVWIGVQPALGVEGDPMRLLFDRDLTPHPQYAAFYKWLQQDYKADAVVHFGMHGTVEWLPGAPLGNSGLSWSDVLLGNMPNVYVYAANNPSESILAKRRGYGTIISHNVPPYARAGLYKQLATLKGLVEEFREKPEANQSLRAPIIQNLSQTGLDRDCPFRHASADSSSSDPELLAPDSAESVSEEEFSDYVGRIYQYLQVVEARLFSEGLHVLGQPPSPDKLGQYLEAYFGEGLSPEAIDVVSHSNGDSLEAIKAKLQRIYSQNSASTSGSRPAQEEEEKLGEAMHIRRLLHDNTEEMRSILRALNGEYIEPQAGGDLLRDGAGVLPTGRNIHALDPYRMPSQAALERGAAAAKGILKAHRDANHGTYPQTVAVNLWGLDAIKTKGESVAIVLYLVGARPLREATGRVARYELIPLDELGGRPRVDVLCNMSGIFRDSFQNVVELLDDLFKRAAQAPESPDMNFIRKHSSAMTDQGLANSSARLFSNPAGDYGSMVNERVGSSQWENGSELGDTWASRNAFSYGRGSERGTARPEVLKALLGTTDRVVQEIDSVEYGLTDIQEYYANTGALKKAAENARKDGKPVGCSIVETFGKDAKPQELSDVLRLEYRSKLLNPKWAKAMADQGSGGAFEISQRMTAMIGWGATTGFAEKWVFDQAADTYALDQDMADKLRKNNPEAFSNLLKRMLEASGRGMWKADDATLEQLKNMYSDMDAQLEGIK
ncbi:TPA: Magnesium chelatase [Trebouxia sp. C0005]